MSELALKITEDIVKELDKDTIILPSLPEVAMRARDAAEDPQVNAGKLARAVEADAGMSARVIRVSNSPLLRTARPVTDLKMAMARIGIQYACNLITGLAMQQMFQATSSFVDKQLRAVWEHSTKVAGIAHVICKKYTTLAPDQATLAGLVHEIGILPILVYAEENSELVSNSFLLNEVIEHAHPLIGERVLRNWDFPEELIAVPKGYLDFARDDIGPSYSDVVTVANLMSYEGTEHPLTEIPKSSVTAYARLGIDPEAEMDEEAKALMEAAAAAFA